MTASTSSPSSAASGQSKSDFVVAEEIKVLLEGRDKLEQEKILRWVRESLGLQTEAARPVESVVPSSASLHPAPARGAHVASKNIKSFVEEKKPRSDVQFVVTVAYYYCFE